MTVPTPPIVPVTGLRRLMYKTFGWSSLGLGAVGVVVPGIPTTPFLILSSYFFVRSSPKAHAWLLQSRLFGQIMRDWETYKGVTRSLKYTAVGLMGVGLVITSIAELPAAVVATIIALELIGATIVLNLPEVDHSPSTKVLAAPVAM
jgi:uncharacterized protein